MNKKQRIVVIFGGILLAIVLFTTPKYQMFDNRRYWAYEIDDIANQYDIEASIIRGVAVIALTVSAYVFFNKKNKNDK